MVETPLPDRMSIQHIKESFDMPLCEIRRIIDNFHSEMTKGLLGSESSLKMIPTYVDRPTGNETGKFIALDLGGTNFRVFEGILKGAGKSAISGTKSFMLEKRHITGTADVLFDFIAECINAFLKEQKVGVREKRSLGFTFSFPVVQTGIAAGRLKRWTKGFRARGIKGKDVVGLLNHALARRGLCNITVSALVNDTVGTLVARSYEDPDCDVGVILGTGTNACYTEALFNISKWQGLETATGHMIINIEWGNFNKLHQTNYDRQVDQASDNKGEQILEKMVSGMYLGEVARMIFKDLVKRKLLFGGASSSAFNEPKGFKTEYMSMVERDNTGSLSRVNDLLKELGIVKSTVADRRLFKRICKLVSQRGARISAAAMAAVITKIDPDLAKNHTVAIDGTVYEKYAHFSKRIDSALKEVFGKKSSRVKTVLAKGGSGIGAAIMAATASTMASR